MPLEIVPANKFNEIRDSLPPQARPHLVTAYWLFGKRALGYLEQDSASGKKNYGLTWSVKPQFSRSDRLDYLTGLEEVFLGAANNDSGGLFLRLYGAPLFERIPSADFMRRLRLYGSDVEEVVAEYRRDGNSVHYSFLRNVDGTDFLTLAGSGTTLPLNLEWILAKSIKPTPASPNIGSAFYSVDLADLKAFERLIPQG